MTLIIGSFFYVGEAEGISKNAMSLYLSVKRKYSDVKFFAPIVDSSEWNRRGLVYLKCTWNWMKYLKKLSSNDLLHLHFSIPLSVFFLKHSNGKNRKILVHVWNPYSFGEYGSALHLVANSRFMTRRVLGGINYPIVVSSRFMLRQMQDLGLKNSIHLLPAGVDIRTFCPSPIRKEDRGRIRLLYYGHLTPNKGVKNLVGAIPRIIREFKAVELQIYWSGYGSREEIDRLIRTLNLQNYVTVLKEKIDVASLLHTVDIGILPLVSPVGTASPPTSLLEMMASKIPVVATNIGGISEIIQDGVNGILCEPNEESLANGIIRLLSDKTLREKIGEEARKLTVEKFDWELVADQYLDFYEEITND